MAEVVNHGIMSRLIDDLELEVIKSNQQTPNVNVNGEDLLILIEYARQCEYIIKMMDADPKAAQNIFKY